MKLRYTRQAIADLDDARAFIADHTSNAAAAVAEQIREVISGLRLYPERGRPGLMEGTGELVVPNTPFVVAYRSDGHTVDILAIMHTARRWPGAFHT